MEENKFLKEIQDKAKGVYPKFVGGGYGVKGGK